MRDEPGGSEDSQRWKVNSRSTYLLAREYVIGDLFGYQREHNGFSRSWANTELKDEVAEYTKRR